jgi:hypothetical protein
MAAGQRVIEVTTGPAAKWSRGMYRELGLGGSRSHRSEIRRGGLRDDAPVRRGYFITGTFHAKSSARPTIGDLTSVPSLAEAMVAHAKLSLRRSEMQAIIDNSSMNRMTELAAAKNSTRKLGPFN